MLLSRKQKRIPERLSHYTDLEALKSILSDKEGKGICLWAFSNKYKNDDQEIKMGEYMLKRVRSVLPPNASLINQFGDYENSASISFMEGEVNQHMLRKYNHYRLEFDLRDLGAGFLPGGLIDCEYVANDQLKAYADEYCNMISNTFYAIPVLQKKYGKTSAPPLDFLMKFFMMELDIMAKVISLKELKWSEEKEWRMVFDLNDKATIRYFDGKPYVECFLDKTKLTGVTIICTPDSMDNAQKDADVIINYIKDRGYNAKVHVEKFE